METTEVKLGVEMGPFVREQICTRLEEALRIAEEDARGRFDRLRALVQEVAERLDGVELTRVARGDVAQPAARLRCAVPATAEGEPVREFLLIPFGEVGVERPVAGESFVFTPRHAESAKRWFDRMGRKLAVDYEHQSFDRYNGRRDGLRPAAGWIGGLEIRGDGLWAVEVTWTERAAELLRSGEYRYFSPVIFWTDEDHTDVAALGPVALTNDPAMHGVPPLAARRGEDSDAEAAVPTDVGAEAASQTVMELRTRVEVAEREAELLRRQLTAQQADTFVERGLRLGKIVDSTSMDWRADYLRDPEATEERLARAPVLLPPGRVVALDRGGEVAARPRVTEAGGGERGETWKVEAADLTAYEQAVAAGRVRSAGR